LISRQLLLAITLTVRRRREEAMKAAAGSSRRRVMTMPWSTQTPGSGAGCGSVATVGGAVLVVAGLSSLVTGVATRTVTESTTWTGVDRVIVRTGSGEVTVTAADSGQVAVEQIERYSRSGGADPQASEASAARNCSHVSARSCGSTRVLPIAVMKFVSPDHRGTTWKCR
jgi:hypothetical protein